MRKEQESRLRQIRGDLNDPLLESALSVVARLKLLDPLIERFALGAVDETLENDRTIADSIEGSGANRQVITREVEFRDRAAVTIIGPDGPILDVPLSSKHDVARALLDAVATRLPRSHS